MGDKKKLLSILISLLIIVLISGSLTLIYFNKRDGSDTNDGEITRGEWIEVLSRSLGMDDFQNEEPYFDDIPKDSSIYPFVQSCYEWDVLKFEDNEFKPNEPATREFIVKTAILATGIPYTPRQPSASEEENILLYAMENGIIDSIDPEYLNETVTISENVSAAEWASDTYCNKEIVEYTNIEIKEEVIDYTSLTADNITVNNDRVEISEEYAENINIGDVFISPATVENPYGVAHKVTSITYEDGKAILQVAEPELGDIYNELEFAARAVPDIDNIILAEGIELVRDDTSTDHVNHNGTILPLAYSKASRNIFTYSSDSYLAQQTGKDKGFSFTFDVDLRKDEISFNPVIENEFAKLSGDLTGNISDDSLELFLKKTGFIIELPPEDKDDYDFEKQLSATNTLKGGYEIKGSLAIKNLYIDTEFKTKKAFGVPYGIQYFIVESNCDIETSLSVKGNLVDEQEIATIPIPIITGITIDVDIILYADFNGQLQVRAEISNNTVTEYSAGNTKKTSKQSEDFSCEIGADLEIGPSIKATIKALGMELADVQLKTGVLIEGEAKLVGETKEEVSDDMIVETQGIYLKADVGMYVPTITISVGTGKTLAEKIGIKFKWKIFAKEDGLLKSKHIPFYSNSWTIWEKVEAVDIKEYEKNSDAFGSLVISEYALFMDMNTTVMLEVISLPPGYEREDLMAVSDNLSVVQVDSFGELKAISPGSAVVTVSTKDGKYNVYCAVTVRDNME